MESPKLKIRQNSTDKFIEFIGILSVLSFIALHMYFYASLPDSIPRHFGADGMPDAYSNKNILWLLPIMGTMMYIGMSVLNNYPHIFNYPSNITEENAERHYTMATKLMRSIKVFMCLSFTYITYSSIQMGLGNQEGLGNWFLPRLLGALTLIIGIYLYNAFKKNKS